MKRKYRYKAIITDKRGMVLSIGENSHTKSHTRMYRLSKEHGEPKKIFLHAEIHAILRCKNLDKAKYIQIFRVENDGSLTINDPCPICASAIKAAGLIIKYD